MKRKSSSPSGLREMEVKTTPSGGVDGPPFVSHVTLGALFNLLVPLFLQM